MALEVSFFGISTFSPYSCFLPYFLLLSIFFAFPRNPPYLYSFLQCFGSAFIICGSRSSLFRRILDTNKGKFSKSLHQIGCYELTYLFCLLALFPPNFRLISLLLDPDLHSGSGSSSETQPVSLGDSTFALFCPFPLDSLLIIVHTPVSPRNSLLSV
jgi:hypothetical protein